MSRATRHAARGGGAGGGGGGEAVGGAAAGGKRVQKRSHATLEDAQKLLSYEGEGVDDKENARESVTDLLVRLARQPNPRHARSRAALTSERCACTQSPGDDEAAAAAAAGVGVDNDDDDNVDEREEDEWRAPGGAPSSAEASRWFSVGKVLVPEGGDKNARWAAMISGPRERLHLLDSALRAFVGSPSGLTTEPHARSFVKRKSLLVRTSASVRALLPLTPPSTRRCSVPPRPGTC